MSVSQRIAVLTLAIYSRGELRCVYREAQQFFGKRILCPRRPHNRLRGALKRMKQHSSVHSRGRDSNSVQSESKTDHSEPIFDLEIGRRESCWQFALRFSAEDKVVRVLLGLIAPLLLSSGGVWWFQQKPQLAPQSERTTVTLPSIQK